MAPGQVSGQASGQQGKGIGAGVGFVFRAIRGRDYPHNHGGPADFGTRFQRMHDVARYLGADLSSAQGLLLFWHANRRPTGRNLVGLGFVFVPPERQRSHDLIEKVSTAGSIGRFFRDLSTKSAEADLHRVESVRFFHS